MKLFDTFESQVSEILTEGKYEDVMSFAKRATGSSAFDTTGLMRNKYDPKKNYYPNIRAGAGAFFKNVKLDVANQNLVNVLNGLRTKSPREFISDGFSRTAASNAENNVNSYIQNFENISKNIPLPPDTNITEFLQEAKGIDFKTLLDKNVLDRLNQKINNYNEYLKNGIKTLAFGQKGFAHLKYNEFRENLSAWNTALQIFKSGKNNIVDPIEGTDILTRDTRGKMKIIRDQWDSFLNNIQNSIVGSSQRGYASGASPISIITGRGYTGKRRNYGEYELKAALDPNVVKEFHESIMMPLFMSKPAVLLYATPEQWEQISQGSKAFKGAAGVAGFLGKQFMSAGANRPKVSL